MADEKQTVIRVYKKKGHGHGGHHGGAWKVAYADFVTAMMAFFLVMWLISMQPEVADSVQGYFNNPIGFKQAYSSGDNAVMEASPAAATMAFLASVRRGTEEARFEETAERLQEALDASPQLEQNGGEVEVAVEDDGLRIELVDTGVGGSFFESGSSAPRPQAVRALRIISTQLQELPHPIVLEGHTDAAALERSGYTNWELSTDRAHAARRLLESFGLPRERFREVRGYADRRLANAENPLDPSNRRVSILLPFQTPEQIEGGDAG